MISPGQRSQRARQAIGLMWIALAIVLFAAVRAGWHVIFLPRWWILW